MKAKQVCTKSLSKKALSLIHEFLYIHFQDFTATKPNNGLHVVLFQNFIVGLNDYCNSAAKRALIGKETGKKS